MSNRRKEKRKRRNPKPGKNRVKAMTAADLEKIEKILQRMKIDLERSIKVCHETGRAILNEERHEFWALVKYTENVQEGIVQLDEINKTIFPRLIEFPERSAKRTETSWKDLKGMRSRLAHAFDNIDHEILWDTATHDFLRLAELLAILQIIRIEGGAINFSFKAGILRKLPKVKEGERLEGGNSIPTIMFDENGEAICLRIGLIADDRIVVNSSKEGFKMEKILLVDPKDERLTEQLWPTTKKNKVDLPFKLRPSRA